MSRTVTKRQAERALRIVAKKHGIKPHQCDGNAGPALIKNWDWMTTGVTPWAIVWEGGDFEWAYRDSWDITHIFAEPITSWSIGLYPN